MPFSQPLEFGIAKILAHILGVEVSALFFFVHFFFNSSNVLSTREFQNGIGGWGHCGSGGGNARGIGCGSVGVIGSHSGRIGGSFSSVG